MSGILRREHEHPPPTATWSWWEGLAVVLLAVGIGHVVRLLLLGDRTSPTAQVARRMVAELVWVIVVAVWLALRRHRWTPAFGRPARPWREVADGAVFGAILYGAVALGVALPVAAIVRLVTDRVVGARDPFPEALPPIGWMLAGALALVVAPLAEEVLFRGVLFPALRNRFGLAAGVAGSAAAFGLVHYVPGDPLDTVIDVAATAAMGVGLAIQVERRRTLLAPIAAHVAFNALGLLILLRR